MQVQGCLARLNKNGEFIFKGYDGSNYYLLTKYPSAILDIPDEMYTDEGNGLVRMNSATVTFEVNHPFQSENIDKLARKVDPYEV